MNISTIINEFAEERINYFNAVTPPIVQTSNFAFKSVEDLRNAFEKEYDVWLYSRGNNPTVDILRKKLAALDGAEDCLVFNSGAAAIFASVLANVKSGDHIVSVNGVYTWARKMFEQILPRFGVTHTYIDGTEIINFKKAIQKNTTIFYLESPNSWTFDLQDLKAVATLAKANNILTICDNSYCTALYQKPIELGIDLVLQSATKYIGGHSDVVAGVLTGSKSMIEKIFYSEYMTIGSGIQPFNAWLLIRGLRTLTARMEKITTTTFQVVDYLLKHPKVEEVVFPFNASFAQYELAKQQMKTVGGLLTFIIKVNNANQIEEFCNNLKHILMAVSWGGYESLIIPKYATIAKNEFDSNNLWHKSLRLYVGLEEPDYIINDLEQAFSRL
ncbi:MAG TPA: PLP-dependent aspartate aminotransferase family protein [Chitinophagaceae bacterium]|nr:PLP-dependent aspartate aminotransferase family protein [Chitinophagaceae bacterium]HMZ46165.1 PLP-dependent aspartate aminotransferase family protein [Chitinophagaceae bacterium]HNE93307.1 PLP-dependent aspartate aminotransferase family protein [Chitinophagaceae bacterium]HNM33423.1 PLP-dependent aspartate aminotransferase family protein [Chitinophagaceae bacterium]HNN30350.1 PLP-dependent aspartate aminotransferase family protein [Chitinophagaceae bacterium]